MKHFVLIMCLIGDIADLDLARARLKVVEVPVPGYVQPIQRKKVKMYSATWCKWCPVAKAELKKKNPDFDIEEIDVDKLGYPNCDDKTIPHFEWEGGDQEGLLYSKWNSADDLIGKVKVSRKRVVQKTISNPLSGNYQHFGVRGMTMEWHVRHDHGIDTSGMTAQEIQQAHNAVHAGVSASRINEYVRSRRK